MIKRLSKFILPITAPFVLASTTSALTFESVGETLGLGNADLKSTSINVLQWILGIMLLVAVAMIIFSGFIAATSQDTDRAATAKRVITGALIGIVVILLSWAIVIYVANTTVNVTQP